MENEPSSSNDFCSDFPAAAREYTYIEYLFCVCFTLPVYVTLQYSRLLLVSQEALLPLQCVVGSRVLQQPLLSQSSLLLTQWTTPFTIS